jgi:hypothetical protein
MPGEERFPAVAFERRWRSFRPAGRSILGGSSARSVLAAAGDAVGVFGVPSAAAVCTAGFAAVEAASPNEGVFAGWVSHPASHGSARAIRTKQAFVIVVPSGGRLQLLVNR